MVRFARGREIEHLVPPLLHAHPQRWGYAEGASLRMRGSGCCCRAVRGMASIRVQIFARSFLFRLLVSASCRSVSSLRRLSSFPLMPALFSLRVRRIRQMRRQRASWKHDNGRPLPYAPRSSLPRRRCRGAVRSRPPPVPTGEEEGRCFLRRWSETAEEKGGAELTVESETICHCATERYCDEARKRRSDDGVQCSGRVHLVASAPRVRHIVPRDCRLAYLRCSKMPLSRARSRLLGFSGLQEGFDLSHVTPGHLYGARDRSTSPHVGRWYEALVSETLCCGSQADCATDAAAASSNHGAAVTTVYSCTVWLIGLLATLKAHTPMRLTLSRALLYI